MYLSIYFTIFWKTYIDYISHYYKVLGKLSVCTQQMRISVSKLENSITDTNTSKWQDQCPSKHIGKPQIFYYSPAIYSFHYCTSNFVS